MGRVGKKPGSGRYGNSRTLKSRVRFCRVLKKLGFGREFSGSGIPGPITNFYTYPDVQGFEATQEAGEGGVHGGVGVGPGPLPPQGGVEGGGEGLDDAALVELLVAGQGGGDRVRVLNAAVVTQL